MKCALRVKRATGALLAALVLPDGTWAHDDEEPDPYASTVVGEPQPRSSASAQRLGGDEISLLPRRGAEDLLRSVPGLTLSQHGSEGKGHQFFLRGFDAGHGADFEVTMEGIPLNEWSNVHGQGYLDLAHLVPEAVESIQVTKGPFEIHQGAFAVAGSAAYRLGIPAQRRGLFGAYSIGTTNRHRGVLTLSGKEGGDFLAVEGLHDTGFGQNRDIDRAALLARLRLVENREKGDISLLAAAQLSRFGLPGALREDALGAQGFFDAADPEGRGESGRAILGITARREGEKSETWASAFASYRVLEIAENYTLFLEDPVNGDRRLQRQRSLQSGLRLGQTYRLSAPLGLETGAGLTVDSLRQEELHVGAEEIPLAQERALSGIQAQAHLLGGLHLQPTAGLRLFAGARAELAWVEMRDGAQARVAGSALTLAPRTSAAWKIAEPWRLYAAYGRGFRPPEARNYDDAPKMTAADTAELGLHWLPGPRLRIGGSAFASFLESESFYDHVSGSFLELDASRRLGAEFELEMRPSPTWRLGADLSYVDARFVESRSPIPYAPWLVAGGRAYWQSPNGSQAGLRIRYLAPRHLPHGARGSSQVVADLLAAHTWKDFRLALEVENLFDTRNREGEFHFPSRPDPRQPASRLPALHFVPGPPLGARLTLSAHLP